MVSQQSQSRPDITFGHAVVNGIRLHFAECGAANDELVLLLHGFPEFWYSWRHQLPVLGERYHVVAPDLRGYNLSDKPPSVDDYHIDVLVEDVIGLIDHFRAEKATIVGHDWGAGVAWACAQKRPERVARLAVMQVPHAAAWRANMSLQQLLRSWYMFFFQLPKLPEWAISRKDFDGIEKTFTERVVNKEAFTRTDVDRYKEAIRRSGSLTAAINYYRANVGRVLFKKNNGERTGGNTPTRVPTLFIFGELDFAIIPRTVQGVQNYVSGPFREVRLPNSGHWVQNEAPQEVNKALLEFMSDKLLGSSE